MPGTTTPSANKARSPSRKAQPPTALPQASLTAAQLRIAQLYASMDDFTQEQIMKLFIALSVKCPRQSAPALRLVKGGAVCMKTVVRFQLTPAELAWAESFFTSVRRLDGRDKTEIPRLSLYLAQECDKRRERLKAPALRLVKGGAA